MPADGTGASERLSVKCHSGHALLPLEVIRELGDVVKLLGKHRDQGDVIDRACIALVAPPLRRELAHSFTLRTECHPENECALTLIVRSSGLI